MSKVNNEFEKHYTLKQVKKLMADIASEHGLELTYMTKDQGVGGYNYGGSTGEEIMIAPFKKCCGGDEIDGYLIDNGCSNPVECMLITFFHELSHCVLGDRIPSKMDGFSWNDTSRFQYEVWVTMHGIEYAHEHYGIKFSDQSVQWILSENMTYVHNNPDDVGYGLIQKNPNSRSYSVRGLEKSVFTL